MPHPTNPCRHLHTDGRQCGSPALRGEPLCFYHHTARKPMPRRDADDLCTPQLPAPDDFLAIQRAVGEVLRLLANDRLTDRRAATLLRGLAIASANLARHHRREEKLATHADALALEPVTDYTNDPTHGTLALPTHQDTPQHPTDDTQTPVPDPIPLLTPDPSPNTSYDDAKLVEIHARFTDAFRLKLQTFEHRKSLELEALYDDRYAQLQADFEARYQARLAPPTPPQLHTELQTEVQTSPQQNQDFRTSSEKPEPHSLALAS